VNTFQHVIDELGSALGRIAASYERNAALREELLQEIQIEIFKALPRLREQAKRRSFVLRIAHNCCVDHVVRHAGAPRSTDVPVDLHSADGSPEQKLMGRQQANRLVDAVRRLELPYRQVITLLLEDMSYVEIAEILGISVANVGVRVSRAKSQLKEYMADD
jgi:RNA polymerase sigma factor (sigma-70 family)